MSAMHDNPAIYPQLPAKPDDEIDYNWLARLARERDEWRACWEFVLTHRLTDGEGSAFWHGANLAYEAMQAKAAKEDR